MGKAGTASSVVTEEVGNIALSQLNSSSLSLWQRADYEQRNEKMVVKTRWKCLDDTTSSQGVLKILYVMLALAGLFGRSKNDGLKCNTAQPSRNTVQVVFQNHTNMAWKRSKVPPPQYPCPHGNVNLSDSKFRFRLR